MPGYMAYPNWDRGTDQGYRTYQPATLGQLNHLRSYVDRIIGTVNSLIDEYSGLEDRDEKLEDDINAVQTEIADILKDIDALKANDTTLADTINKLDKRLQAVEAQMAKWLETGMLTSTTFTAVDHGIRQTVKGTKADVYHDLTFHGDDTVQVGVTQSANGTDVTLTTKGTTDGPDAISVAQPGTGAGFDLMHRQTKLGSYRLTSSDQSLELAESDGPSTDMKLGKRYTDDLAATGKRIDGDESRLGVLETHPWATGLATSGDKAEAGTSATLNLTPLLETLKGDKSNGTPTTVVVTSKDGTVTLDTSTDADHAVLDLSAPENTVKTIGAFVTQAVLKLADKVGIGLTVSRYDVASGKSTDTTTSVYLATDANLKTSQADGTITLDGQPGVDAANKHSDEALAAALKTRDATIDALTKRLDALEATVKDMQTDMATFNTIAKRSVTNAAMNVTPGDDKLSYTMELDLQSNDGTSIAKLPITVRLISQKNTLSTGVQTSGTVVTLDVNTVDPAS